MKKFVVILLALLLLGGGGAAAWWFYVRQPEAETVSPEPVYSFIELPTIPVARIKNGRADKLFNVQVVLLFDNREKKEKIAAVLPAVTDAIIAELHQLLPRKMLEQKNFDQDLIRMRLEKAVTRRIGQGWIYRLSIRNLEQIELR
jgi:flagellar basal body-associated protein FliL